MRKITKSIMSMLLVAALLVTTGNLGFSMRSAQASNHMKGVWLSFIIHATESGNPPHLCDGKSSSCKPNI